MTVAVRAEGPQINAERSEAMTSAPFARFALTAIVLSVVVMALGSLVAPDAVVEVLVGATIALIASFAGTAPLRKIDGPQGASWVVPSVLAAMGLRMAVALGLGLFVALTGWLVVTPLLLTLVAAHLVLLFADTGYARALADRASTVASEPASAGQPADSNDSKMEDR